MPSPRNILNGLKWREGFDLKKAEIWYVHRGAPNDTKVISGNNILVLERSFMHTVDAMIPYHRILKIVYDEKVIFERRHPKHSSYL